MIIHFLGEKADIENRRGLVCLKTSHEDCCFRFYHVSRHSCSFDAFFLPDVKTDDYRGWEKHDTKRNKLA